MEKPVEKRSTMEVTMSSRLLGVAITIFILMLTIKSELLSYKLMAIQLVLSIPFLIGSMTSSSKILTPQTLKRYVVMNRIFFSTASAFVLNALGLLISRYISLTIGMVYFVVSIIVLFSLIVVDIDKSNFMNKLMHEILMIILMIVLGILPAIGLMSYP